MLPLNIKTYYMDVNKANAEGQPTWELFDNYLEDYGLKDLSPSSMKDLASRIKADPSLAKEWYWNQYRRGMDEPTDVD